MSASAAPSSQNRQSVYRCGPVRLVIDFDESEFADCLNPLLSQYDAPWDTAANTIHVLVQHSDCPADFSEVSGSYLTLQRLRVDLIDQRLVAIGPLGSRMDFDLNLGRARILVPTCSDRAGQIEEVEQQFVLLLARAWAQSGWTPLHAGSLVPPGQHRCILLCAPSGSGKTTLTSALLRRGWKTLGDDKTLLRMQNGTTCARALAHRFHLHPEAARWFPEARNLSDWPRYSRWTDKRVVQIEAIWPGRLLVESIPGGLVQVERSSEEFPLTVVPLNTTETFNVLLRQIVVPGEASHARPLVNCAAQTASRLRGARVRVGHNAFLRPQFAEELEKALLSLLA